jgi:broad specificity phosphatase PhoE
MNNEVSWQQSNNLFQYQKLVCEFYVMRHGLSLPNLRDQIVSDLENGIKAENGLSEEGHKQVSLGIIKAQAEYGFGKDIIIVSSPFSRARESAELSSGFLGTKEPVIDDCLRERYFGSFNNLPLWVWLKYGS